MFQISDKVVCIDDSPGLLDGRKALVNGQIYVVEDVCKVLGYPDCMVALKIVGIHYFWLSPRFRKLNDIKEANRIRASAEAKEADQEHRRNIASWAEQINAFYRQAKHNPPS